jgi:serine/threonine protein kinase
MRFVGPMPHPVNPKAYKDEFELAERFQIVNRPQSSLKLLTRRHWRTELEAIPDPPVPQDLLDFIESLLIIDPEKRPTAAEALLHPFFDFDESSVNSSAVQLPSAEVVQEKDSSTHTLDGQEITVDGIGFRISSSS